MNNREFVSVIRNVIREPAIDGIIQNLESPPGRNPKSEDIDISEWYRKLSGKEKFFISYIISKSVDSALFDFFCILDGVRSIESPPDKGRLLLKYKRGKEEILLNNFEDEFLHDIYNLIREN